MLDEVGIKLPNHKVRDIVQDIKIKGDTEFLAKSGFEEVILIIDKNQIDDQDSSSDAIVTILTCSIHSCAKC